MKEARKALEQAIGLEDAGNPCDSSICTGVGSCVRQCPYGWSSQSNQYAFCS